MPLERTAGRRGFFVGRGPELKEGANPGFGGRKFAETFKDGSRYFFYHADFCAKDARNLKAIVTPRCLGEGTESRVIGVR